MAYHCSVCNKDVEAKGIEFTAQAAGEVLTNAVAHSAIHSEAHKLTCEVTLATDVACPTPDCKGHLQVVVHVKGDLLWDDDEVDEVEQIAAHEVLPCGTAPVALTHKVLLTCSAHS
jgi:hypothetical protein